MSVLMRGKKVGVEKMVRSSNYHNSYVAMPDDASAVGYIRFLGKDLESKSDLKVGMKVYYGKNRHELKINGIDILVMEEDNIYAVDHEDSQSQDLG